jgi:hypothetical protein
MTVPTNSRQRTRLGPGLRLMRTRRQEKFFRVIYFAATAVSRCKEPAIRAISGLPRRGSAHLDGHHKRQRQRAKKLKATASRGRLNKRRIPLKSSGIAPVAATVPASAFLQRNTHLLLALDGDGAAISGCPCACRRNAAGTVPPCPQRSYPVLEAPIPRDSHKPAGCCGDHGSRPVLDFA